MWLFGRGCELSLQCPARRVDMVDREPVVLARDRARLWRVLSAGMIHRTSLAQSEWGELAGGLE